MTVSMHMAMLLAVCVLLVLSIQHVHGSSRRISRLDEMLVALPERRRAVSLDEAELFEPREIVLYLDELFDDPSKASIVVQKKKAVVKESGRPGTAPGFMEFNMLTQSRLTLPSMMSTSTSSSKDSPKMSPPPFRVVSKLGEGTQGDAYLVLFNASDHVVVKTTTSEESLSGLSQKNSSGYSPRGARQFSGDHDFGYASLLKSDHVQKGGSSSGDLKGRVTGLKAMKSKDMEKPYLHRNVSDGSAELALYNGSGESDSDDYDKAESESDESQEELDLKPSFQSQHCDKESSSSSDTNSSSSSSSSSSDTNSSSSSSSCSSDASGSEDEQEGQDEKQSSHSVIFSKTERLYSPLPAGNAMLSSDLDLGFDFEDTDATEQNQEIHEGFTEEEMLQDITRRNAKKTKNPEIDPAILEARQEIAILRQLVESPTIVLVHPHSYMSPSFDQHIAVMEYIRGSHVLDLEAAGYFNPNRTMATNIKSRNSESALNLIKVAEKSREQYNGDNLLAELAYDMLDALLHMRNCSKGPVVHRDIKPENVMAEFNVESTAVQRFVLVDFGLSVQMQKDGEKPVLDAAGTDDYLAPEILTLRNTKSGSVTEEASPYDHRSDLWSLGMMVWSLRDWKCVVSRDNRFREAHLKSLAAYAKAYDLPVDLLGEDYNTVAAAELQSLKNQSTEDKPLSFNSEDPSKEMVEFALRCMAEDPKDRWSIEDAVASEFIQRNVSSERSEYLKKIKDIRDAQLLSMLSRSRGDLLGTNDMLQDIIGGIMEMTGPESLIPFGMQAHGQELHLKNMQKMPYGHDSQMVCDSLDSLTTMKTPGTLEGEEGARNPTIMSGGNIHNVQLRPKAIKEDATLSIRLSTIPGFLETTQTRRRADLYSRDRSEELRQSLANLSMGNSTKFGGRRETGMILDEELDT